MVGGNYIWYLVIFVKFMGVEASKKWRGDALKSSFGVAMQVVRGRGQF